MRPDQKVTVYRLMYATAGRDIMPRHMWGTREAIATLRDCVPVEESAREVHRKLLDPHGFLFEHTPTPYSEIDEPPAEK